VITAVPGATPLTMPVEPADAIEPLLLVQVPPDTVLDNVVVLPVQMTAVPVIVAGAVFTVISTVALTEPQPDVLV